MLNKRLWQVGLVLAAVLVAGLACNLGSRATPTPTATVPVTTEAVQSMQEQLSAAATQASSTGQVTLVFTEAQLTSLVALELQSQGTPLVQEPQVLLRDGQVRVTGKVQQGGLTAPLEVILTVSADSQGRPDYHVVSAKIGVLPLPDSMLGEISTRLDQAFATQIRSDAGNVFIDSITVADGTMTIKGHVRP